MHQFQNVKSQNDLFCSVANSILFSTSKLPFLTVYPPLAVSLSQETDLLITTWVWYAIGRCLLHYKQALHYLPIPYEKVTTVNLYLTLDKN